MGDVEPCWTYYNGYYCNRDEHYPEARAEDMALIGAEKERALAVQQVHHGENGKVVYAGAEDVSKGYVRGIDKGNAAYARYHLREARYARHEYKSYPCTTKPALFCYDVSVPREVYPAEYDHGRADKKPYPKQYHYKPPKE